jgi:hypothetical protein
VMGFLWGGVSWGGIRSCELFAHTCS